MFYVKNVPVWERIMRVTLGLIAAAAALLLLQGVWGTVIAASAGGLVLSGLFGFCPACAMVGRRLDRSAK